MFSTERLYLTEDDRVVPAGDPDARWLFAAVGSEIPDAAAAKYGLDAKPKSRPETKSEPDPDPEPDPEPEPETSTDVEEAPVRKGGRPKGSRNKPKAA